MLKTATLSLILILSLLSGIAWSQTERGRATHQDKKFVKVFGQPSAGYTTANYTYYLSDGSMLNLAQMYVADRTFKAYRDKIVPDVLVDNKKDAADATRTAAENWLLRAGR